MKHESPFKAYCKLCNKAVDLRLKLDLQSRLHLQILCKIKQLVTEEFLNFAWTVQSFCLMLQVKFLKGHH